MRIQHSIKIIGKQFTKLPIKITLAFASLSLLTACAENDDVSYGTESQSSSIALTSDDKRVVVVNREANTVSVIKVRNKAGKDANEILAEIPVGNEPRYVAIHPDNSKAFVTNAADGTVSIINLKPTPPELDDHTIDVGSEPRGIALTPSGQYAFVANHTEGTVSVIETDSFSVINTIATGGNPTAVAITNNGDNEDADETVFVTRFFSELISESRVDGFDDAKQGIVDSFSVAAATDDDNEVTVSQITLAPQNDSGFTADRRQFCSNTRNILQANQTVVFFPSGPTGSSDGAARLANETFCPDITSTDASKEGPIGSHTQGVYPNILNGLLIRNNTLYAPNIGVQPEPPVFFENNVQALVSIVDLDSGEDKTTNLNAQINLEPEPQPPSASLAKVFGNDIVAITADAAGGEFFIVSRGGNYVIRASLDAQKKLDIQSPDNVVRFQTGNMPTGIVLSSDGKRAYTNNEINVSVSVIDIENNQVLQRDLHASTPPEPGTAEHRIAIGKLAFFTALGIPDTLDTDSDGTFDIPIRAIDPLQFRGKASNSGWSSCASCHEDGRTDNVTWIFPTGPVQTVPLEGSFAKHDLSDQRIFNWNGVRGSITDFNNNSRGVQGGLGFATNVNGTDKTQDVFNHGVTNGISDALDALTEWVATIRALNMPPPQSEDALIKGSEIFEIHCASCHGGTKWTKSRTTPVYQNNPTFAENPIGSGFFTAGPAPGKVPTFDSRLTIGGSSIVKIDDPVAGTLTFLDDVGTFNPDSIIGIRGAGAIAGQSTQGFAALGGTGFNSPSLLGVGYHAPYLHDGSALTLQAVFDIHRLPALPEMPTISTALEHHEIEALRGFVASIDDETPIFDSATDDFLNQGGGVQ